MSEINITLILISHLGLIHVYEPGDHGKTNHTLLRRIQCTLLLQILNTRVNQDSTKYLSITVEILNFIVEAG